VPWILRPFRLDGLLPKPGDSTTYVPVMFLTCRRVSATLDCANEGGMVSAGFSTVAFEGIEARAGRRAGAGRARELPAFAVVGLGDKAVSEAREAGCVRR